MVFLFVLINFEPILDSFLEVLEKSRNPRWRTKMTAIQTSDIRNYYVMRRHHVMMRTPKGKFLGVLSNRQVSLS